MSDMLQLVVMNRQALPATVNDKLMKHIGHIELEIGN